MFSSKISSPNNNNNHLLPYPQSNQTSTAEDIYQNSAFVIDLNSDDDGSDTEIGNGDDLTPEMITDSPPSFMPSSSSSSSSSS